MSKLIDNITAEATGRKYTGRPKTPHLLSVECSADTTIPFFTEYRVRVTLGCHLRSDKILGAARRHVDGPDLVEQVALMIEQEVFGEFRDDIQAIRRALWNDDGKEALARLDKLENKMFSTRGHA